MKMIIRIQIATLIFGLSASMTFGQTHHRVTERDCNMFFPRSHSNEMTRSLDTGVSFAEVWEQGSWGPAEEFYGFVFVKTVQYQGKNIDLLAGVSKTGKILGVRAKGNESVNEAFLAQFKGLTYESNFDLVQTQNDLLSVPSKIKSMQGKVDLSQSIAQGIKEIAQAANTVIDWPSFKPSCWFPNRPRVQSASTHAGLTSTPSKPDTVQVSSDKKRESRKIPFFCTKQSTSAAPLNYGFVKFIDFDAGQRLERRCKLILSSVWKIIKSLPIFFCKRNRLQPPFYVWLAACHPIGATGFEPATPWPPVKCANRTALRPDMCFLKSSLLFFYYLCRA